MKSDTNRPGVQAPIGNPIPPLPPEPSIETVIAEQRAKLERLPQFRALTIVPAKVKVPLYPGTPPRRANVVKGSKDFGSGAYGICTGFDVSDAGIVVLDIDVGNDGAIDWLARNAHRLVGKTLTVATPGGGLHFWFLAVGQRIATKSAMGGIKGVDVRGEVGFLVAPGSVRPEGVYQILDASTGHPGSPQTIAPLPDWLAQEMGAARPARELVHVPRDPSVPAPAVEDLAAVVKGKGKGSPETSELWAAWRDIVAGARFVRVKGGTHGPDRASEGVDVLLRDMAWVLACERPHWRGDDVEALAGASLSILRADDEAAGNRTYDPGDFARKFDSAAEKARAEKASTEALERGLQAAIADVEQNGPKILQDGRDFYLRTGDAWHGPFIDAEVWAAARDRECFPVMKGKGKREVRASAQDFMEDFGKGGHLARVVVDLTRTTDEHDRDARILYRGPRGRGPIPEPRHDPNVAAWLAELFGPQLENGLDWLAWASPEKLDRTAPALAFFGAANVGKSLLAAALARTHGLDGPGQLAKALQRFNATIEASPVLTSDEGIARGEMGRPLTEEFRRLVTETAHQVEPKGREPYSVIGAVRVVLAANNLGRLFSARGDLNGADVAALERRLILVEIEHQSERAARCKALAVGLGRWEGNDPARLERVAGHLRWLQVSRPEREPKPDARALRRELRAGSMGEDMHDRLARLARDPGPNAGVNEAAGVLWVRWSALGEGREAKRALASYDRGTERPRAHPVTGEKIEGERPRWAKLDLVALREDGVIE